MPLDCELVLAASLLLFMLLFAALESGVFVDVEPFIDELPAELFIASPLLDMLPSVVGDVLLDALEVEVPDSEVDRAAMAEQPAIHAAIMATDDNFKIAFMDLSCW